MWVLNSSVASKAYYNYSESLPVNLACRFWNWDSYIPVLGGLQCFLPVDEGAVLIIFVDSACIVRSCIPFPSHYNR